MVGQSLCVSEFGIGDLDLTFEAKKGQKRLILSSKPLKQLERLEQHNIWENNQLKINSGTLGYLINVQQTLLFFEKNFQIQNF